MAISDRGFASMNAKKQREIASKGGHASAASSTSHKSKLSEAGKKGAAAQPVTGKIKGGTNSHKNQ